MLAASIGVTVQAIPSFVSSIVIRHMSGMGIIIMPPGIPMPIPGIIPIPGIMPGIIPGIIPLIGIDIGIIGMPPIVPIGMGMGAIMGIGAGAPDIIGIDIGMVVIGALLPAVCGLDSIRAKHETARGERRALDGAARALSSARADPPPRLRRSRQRRMSSTDTTRSAAPTTRVPLIGRTERPKAPHWSSRSAVAICPATVRTSVGATPSRGVR